jgi:hypothetical protein
LDGRGRRDDDDGGGGGDDDGGGNNNNVSLTKRVHMSLMTSK